MDSIDTIAVEYSDLSKIALRFDAPEQVEDANRAIGLDYEYRQLKPGSLDFRFVSASVSDHTLMIESTAQSVEVEGMTSLDTYTIFTPITDDNLIDWNGISLSRCDVLILPPKLAVHAKVRGSLALSELYVKKNQFDQLLRLNKCRFMEITQPAKIRLSRESWVAFVQCIAGLLADSNAHRLQQSTLYDKHICALAEQVAQQLGCQPMRYRDRTMNRRKTLIRARDYIEENLQNRLFISDISGEAAVSARTLERVFKTELGITPIQYVQARRMNAVRRALLAGEYGDLRVAEAASAHGFAHLGRFSLDYFKFFNESPSSTLKRPPRAA